MIIYIAVFILFVVVLIYYVFISPVSHVLGLVYYRLNTSQKKVALTFDDGPNEPYTTELLSVLAKHNVLATFFVCGACVERHPKIVQKIYNSGHAIGNHSRDHKLKNYLSIKKFIREVDTTNTLIQSLTGVKPTLYRSPWLYRTPSLLRNIAELNMTPIWGQFGSKLEIFQPSPGYMAARAMRLVRPGAIIIFHDGKESVGGFRGNTVAAVDLLIPMVLAKGYEFVVVDKETASIPI